MPTMPKLKTSDTYHRSKPDVPEGLMLLEAWAKSKGLTPVCVRKWGWAGKLAVYRVPGYGLRSFVKVTEADKLIKPQQAVPDLAR
jgi:hypothetical protein